MVQSLDLTKTIKLLKLQVMVLVTVLSKKRIPVLGLEPANTASVAEKKVFPVLSSFLGFKLLRSSCYRTASRPFECNNVLAHVPDVNDFVAGMKILLKPNGILQWVSPPAAAYSAKSV